VDDMVARLWRPIFENGIVDRAVAGNLSTQVSSPQHQELAAELVEEGAVLLKNDNSALPLSKSKYKSVAVFGAQASSKAMVTELHGGFVLDKSMVVHDPLTSIKKRASQANISVAYSEAYPGTSAFPDVPSSMFGKTGLNVTSWTTIDGSGPANQTLRVKNITSWSFPSGYGSVWPEVFSLRYDGYFHPNVTGLYHFSLYGNGGAVLCLNGTEVVNLNGSNFNMVVQGVISLEAGTVVPLRLDYTIAGSVDIGAYSIALGMDVKPRRYSQAVAAAQAADISIVFVSDEHTEGLDSILDLSLPGDQDEVISLIARNSERTIVVLNTNSAILMPWIDQVDAVIEVFYPGQQIGPAITRLLFGDVNFSGKLPITFPVAFNDTPTASVERFPGIGLQANYSEGLYVGYKWYDGNEIEPLFAFGHGLSYTDFALSNGSLTVHNQSDSLVIELSVAVENVGSVYGKEVVQVYVAFPEACDEPPKLLKAFEKVALAPSEVQLVNFTLGTEDLSIWDTSSRDWMFVPGEYTFWLGTSSRDLPINITRTLGTK
jgi:beta-glucosidase